MQIRSSRFLVAASLLVLATLSAGCGGKAQTVLYTVGDRTMTVAEFEDLARGNEGSFLGDPDHAKQVMLEDLLRRDLLLRAAEDRGLFRDSTTVRFRKAAEARVLVRALFERLTPRNVGVSNAEVAQMVAWQDSVSHAFLIYTPTRAAADAALRELRSGADFTQVAQRYNSQGILPPDGDLNYITAGQLVSPLDEAVRTAPLHTVVGPLDAPGEGWFLLTVTERAYRDSPHDEARNAMVREQIRQRKLRMAMQRAVGDLRTAYHFQIAPGGAQALHAYFNQNAGRAQQLQGMGEAPPAGGAEDRSTPLASWTTPAGTHEAYYMGQALDDIESGAAEAPPGNSTPAMDDWIAQQSLQRIALLEAHRRRIDQEPAVRRQIERGVDNLVLDSIYQSDVLPHAATGDSVVSAYYEGAQQEFRELLGADLRTVVFPDSARAAAFLQHAGHAKSVEDALVMVKETLPVRDTTVRFPSSDSPWRELRPLIQILPERDYGGPYPSTQGWLAFQVARKEMRTTPFAQLPLEQQRLVSDRAHEAARDAALHDVTERLREQYKPVVHPERLKSIPWPVPPLPGGADGS